MSWNSTWNRVASGTAVFSVACYLKKLNVLNAARPNQCLKFFYNTYFHLTNSTIYLTGNKFVPTHYAYKYTRISMYYVLRNWHVLLAVNIRSQCQCTNADSRWWSLTYNKKSVNVGKLFKSAFYYIFNMFYVVHVVKSRMLLFVQQFYCIGRYSKFTL